MAKSKVFKTEADLCDSFIKWISQHGWVAYPETCDWDILCVRKEDGAQLGVQAKLHFNATLLRQVLYLAEMETGPDFRSILIPESNCDIRSICERIGIACFDHGAMKTFTWMSGPRFNVGTAIFDNLPDWNPAKRHELPEFIPDTKAGTKSPIILSKWKVSALRVCAHLETHGTITRKDIRQYGIDPSRWTIPELGWLKRTEVKGVYTAGEKLHFPEQHPEVYRQILEQFQK